MSAEIRIRCGDVVHHRPSGEDWVVAYADYETGDLSAFGWPDSIGRLADCDMVRRASDEEHAGYVARTAGELDRRGAIIQRLYGEARAKGPMRVPIDLDTHDMAPAPVDEWAILIARLRAWPAGQDDALNAATVAALLSEAASALESLPVQMREAAAEIEHSLEWLNRLPIPTEGASAHGIRLFKMAKSLRKVSARTSNEIARLTKERDDLYGALVSTGNAIGAILKDGVSIEFLMRVPMEAALVVASLKAEAAKATRIAEHSRAGLDVLAERQRQVTEEGRTPEHDDTYRNGELARAAACYAENAGRSDGSRDYVASVKRTVPPGLWPWAIKWWKPKDRRRDLVRAGALIVADIERLDRSGTYA